MGLYKPPLYISIYSGLFTFCPFYGGRSQLNGHPHIYTYLRAFYAQAPGFCTETRFHLSSALGDFAETLEDLFDALAWAWDGNSNK